MDQVTLIKSIAEEVKVKGMPLDVMIDCLSLREGRVSTCIANVRDDMEAELNQVRQTDYIYEGSDRQTNKKRWKHQNDDKFACRSIAGIIRRHEELLHCKVVPRFTIKQQKSIKQFSKSLLPVYRQTDE